MLLLHRKILSLSKLHILLYDRKFTSFTIYAEFSNALMTFKKRSTKYAETEPKIKLTVAKSETYETNYYEILRSN